MNFIETTFYEMCLDIFMVYRKVCAQDLVMCKQQENV